MSSNNKRKSAATLSSSEDAPSKRRRSVRQSVIAEPISTNFTYSPMAQTMSRPIARPKRWRRAQQPTDSESPIQSNGFQPATQLRQQSQWIRDQKAIPASCPTGSQNVALQFSFAAAEDQKPSNYQHNNQPLNQSFSKLLVAANISKSTSGFEPQQKFTAHETVPVVSVIPNLSKPKKKREGYGFSYSETFWCDSDEYPDTECEWSVEEQTTQPLAGRSTSIKQGHEWKSEAQTTQASFGGSTVVDEGCSFEDVVVMRDVGSFHIARPQRILSCTKATREDTIRLQTQAKALFSKYEESGDIQAQLLTRLERMVLTEQQKKVSDSQVPSVTYCALKLHDFLTRIREERIRTGEHRRLVEHEIEWVEWLVEASRTGVMHLKTAGCQCRPDWEEG